VCASLAIRYTPRQFAYGTHKELITDAAELARCQRTVEEIFLARCPRHHVVSWMDGQDHYLTAEQALKAGLIDEIIEAPAPPDYRATLLPAAAANDPDKAAEDITIELLLRLRGQLKNASAFQAVLKAFCSSGQAASAGG